MKQQIGQFILGLIRKKGMSLRQLSRESGLSNSYLSQMTRGVFVPMPDALVRLAYHLGVDVRTFYERCGWLDPCRTKTKSRPVTSSLPLQGKHHEKRNREVAEFIVALAKAKNKNLRKLSQESGVSDPYLSQLSRGLYSPTPDILVKLAPSLGVKVDVLFKKAGWL